MDSYDVIIIGTGAGGGTLARHLAPSGKRILLLERGDWLPREPENWSTAGRVRRQPLRLARHVVRRQGQGVPAAGATTSSAVRRSSTARRSTGCARRTSASCSHHDGISPAWPISYDELEPYYTLAEQLYQVHGARGEDPTEPPASAPYPFPAVSHEPRIQQLADELAAAGYHPFHAPCGVRLDEANMPYSTCVRCGTATASRASCTRKSDAEVLGVRPGARASERHAADEREGRQARDERRRHGRHRGRRRAGRRDGAVRGRRRRRLAAARPTPPSCCSQSASDKHPNGLANGSDQVGRNYMFHDSPAVLALSREENPTVFQKTLGLNDFYFGSDDFEYPLGNIQMVGKSQAPMFRGEKPGETKLAPEWTLERIARHAIDFWLSTEDLPRPDNRVTRRPRRQAHARLHGDERRRRRSGCTRSSSRCSASST